MNANDFAVSSWSLHNALGLFYSGLPNGKDRNSEARWGEGTTTLLDMPRLAAEHGIGRVEICHFHFPSTSPQYLTRLKEALAEANVEFFSLLIDAGDITAADPEQRGDDLAMIRDWITIASYCGAKRARVSAGHTPADSGGEVLKISVAGFQELTQHAKKLDVRLETENWHALLDHPQEVNALLDSFHGDLGLRLDFGNWPRPRKYDDLPLIAPRAESTHAKAYFSDADELDAEDFARCLDICDAAGYAGPQTLIFDSTGDEWEHLGRMRAFIADRAGE